LEEESPPEAKQELFVRDPIHGFIDLREYPFIEEIVQDERFQRLRRLSQLGFSYLIYPSACHNRFSHSIGAMQLFWELFDRLSADLGVSGEERERLRKIGSAVVLLHDIGHGPFSHVTESIFDFKHIAVTKQLICQPPIADILKRASIDPIELPRVIDGTATGSLVLLSQLVSSQLDVDRLDYLVRDAYFTGIGFGNVDVERIIKTMMLYDKDPLKGQAINLYKSRFSLESYILTRHLMYQAVYFHKATRSAELLLKNLMKRVQAIKDKIDVPEELSFLSEGRAPSAEEVTSIDDNLVYSQIMRWRKCDDNTLRELCDRITQRRLLKAVDIPPDKFAFMMEDGQKQLQALASKHGIDSDYFCPYDNPTDTPYRPYSPKGPDDRQSVVTHIFLLDRDGEPREISRASDVVKSLSDVQYASFRLYCPKEIRDDVRKILK
jgi:HD superfamily phosphohydrolase